MYKLGSRLIPERGTDEWNILAKEWLNGSLEERKEMACRLGYSKPEYLGRNFRGFTAKSGSNFLNTLSDIKNEEKILERILSEKINAIPNLNIHPIKQESHNSEEAQVLLFSDTQVGIKTSSYNSLVFKNRMNQMTNKVIRIGDLRRNFHEIKTLHVFCLGDMVHGERIAKQINLEEFEGPAHWQISEVFVPEFCEALLNLSPHYEKIIVHGIEGNHGWPAGKESSYGTNWDLFAYQLTQAWLSNYKNIEFDCQRDSFYKIVDVMGHNFLLTHGDSIPCTNSLPFYGVTTRSLRWKNSIGLSKNDICEMLGNFQEGKVRKEDIVAKLFSNPFSYVCMGHFHTPTYLTFNDVNIFMNGSFLTGDEYSHKKMGFACPAEQWSFSVHKDRLTSMDLIYLE